MHENALKIISLLRKTNSDLSTSQILESISENYRSLKEKSLKNSNIEIKREIAKMHRKALHHLNSLINFGILNVAKHGKKGEKYYTLNLEEDEEIVGMSPKYRKRIIASKPILLNLPIEGYEKKGIVIRFEPDTWINRLNSVVIFSDKVPNLKELYSILTEKIFPSINDCVVIEDFEQIINREDPSEFILTMEKECEDYGKSVNLVINLSKIEDNEATGKMIETISANKFNMVKFTILTEHSDLEDYKEITAKIIISFLKSKTMVYIRNKALQKAPFFAGKAGPYCFIDKEWQLSDILIKNMFCIGCSQCCVIIDVNKFYNEYGKDINKFSEILLNVSKSILSANSVQRRKSGEFFKRINSLNKGHESDFLSLSRNYIRFWNFGLNEPGLDQDFVFMMINEAKKKIEDFSSAEETIYKSCGMTARFKTSLSSAFSSSANLSSAKYIKLELNDVNDLHKKETKKKLKDRESALSIFSGGDEVTFHYAGELDSKQIIEQIRLILLAYKIPLFNFNFDKTKGNLKITQFLK